MKRFIAALVLTLLACAPPARTETRGLKKWGYLLHTSNPGQAYLERVLNTYDIIAVTGFKLDSEGRIRSMSTPLFQQARELCARGDFELCPLISFASVNAGKKILSSRALRERAALEVRRLVRFYGFRHIHLDFEYLPPSYAPGLVEFLKGLRKRTRVEHISMAVFPRVDFPLQWAGFHNLEFLEPCLDEIVVMCYDYHRPDTGPGPVTDIKWAEKNIQAALMHFPAHRVWLGIPAYGYRWPDKGRASAVSSRSGTRLAKKHGGIRDRSGTVFFTYNIQGRPVCVYFADKKTREMLGELARQYKLAGTATWRRGLE